MSLRQTFSIVYSIIWSKFYLRLPYDTIFGGVVAFTPQQYETVNGLSNSFWGWGGEDDDLYNRFDNSSPFSIVIDKRILIW